MDKERCSPRRGGEILGKKTVTCALTMALLGWAGQGAARAQAPAAPPPSSTEARLVSLEVQDAKLDQVIRLLGAQTNLNNIVIETVPGANFGPVSLRLVDKPMDVVLRAVAKAAGAVLTTGEDGIYYLRPGNGEAAPAPAPTPATPVAAAAADPQNSVVVPQASRVRREKQTVKIPLQFLNPSTFMELLRDPASMHIKQAITFDPEAVLRPRPTVIGSPSTILPNGSIETGGTGTGYNAAGRDSGAAALVAGQGGRLGGGGGGLLGGGGGGGLQGGGGGLQGGQGGNGAGAALVPEGISSVIGIDIDNSLLVQYDDPAALTALRDIIRLLDVPPKQVQIKVEFIDVNISDVNSFGISWQLQPAGNLGVSLPGGGDPASLSLVYSSGIAVASLRAALTTRTSNIIQSPIVTTVNNGLGAVVIQDNVPTVITQQIALANGNVINNSTPISVPSVNSLVVQPRINGDNSITLTVAPQLSSVSITSGPDGVPLIRTASRQVIATRRIQNGETMVLGGFITRNEDRAENKVPILGDLPIIGNLFRFRERRTGGTETLVFLTPAIIEDAATGTTGAVSTPATP